MTNNTTKCFNAVGGLAGSQTVKCTDGAPVPIQSYVGADCMGATVSDAARTYAQGIWNNGCSGGTASVLSVCTQKCAPDLLKGLIPTSQCMLMCNTLGYVACSSDKNNGDIARKVEQPVKSDEGKVITKKTTEIDSTKAQLSCTKCKSSAIGKSGGDANCDGKVDISDYSLWYKEYHQGNLGALVKNNWNADFTGPDGVCDGKVDKSDYSKWNTSFNEFMSRM
jgi:hypothetical protein